MGIEFDIHVQIVLCMNWTIYHNIKNDYPRKLLDVLLNLIQEKEMKRFDYRYYRINR